MAKERKERAIYGIIDEIMIDAEGNEYVPGSEPVEELYEEPVKEPEKVEEVVAQEETPIEEPAEEPAEEPIDEIAAAVVIPEDDKPKFITKTFAMKMVEADEVLQDRYDELKNYALRFKKLKARISRKFDSINKGRLQFVKLSVAGKTLKLYLNMDINSIDAKYHCKDVSDKKTYVTVPVLLRIKSGRAVKYAKILIDRCAEFHGLVENKKFQEVDAMALVEQSLSAKDDELADGAEVAATESEGAEE